MRDEDKRFAYLCFTACVVSNPAEIGLFMNAANPKRQGTEQRSPLPARGERPSPPDQGRATGEIEPWEGVL